MTQPNAWLQLGLGGAALFIVLYLINKVFKYLTEKTKVEAETGKLSFQKIDMLCEEIRTLVAAFHKNTQASTIIQKTVEDQFTLMLGGFKAMEERIQATFNNYFTVLREHDKKSDTTLNELHFEVNGSLDKMELIVGNLIDNCKMREMNKNELQN